MTHPHHSERHQARTRHKSRYWYNRDKEDYVCPECGRGAEEVKQFDLHHIDGDPQNGSDDNLVALCQRCHYQEHGRVPPRDLSQWKREFKQELLTP